MYGAPPPMPVMKQSHPKAVPAGVCGIIALSVTVVGFLGSVLFFLCCPVVAVIGLVMGIIGAVLGTQAKKAINQAPHIYGGAGIAMAGQICGGIAIGLCVGMIALFVVGIVLYASLLMAF